MRSLLLLLLLSSAASGQEVRLPKEVAAPTGMILVTAETDSTEVQWWAPDGGMQVIPPELLRNSKTAVCFAQTPGRYRLQAIVAKDGKAVFAVTTVIVGDAPPIPPGPVPPGPVPPVPPVPTDPLGKAIYDALGKETEADKIASTSALADLYTAASVQVRASTLPKVVDYHASLKALRVAKIGEKVPLVRAEITKYLNSKLPTTTDALLNDTNKNLCSQAFTEVAYALRACCP